MTGPSTKSDSHIAQDKPHLRHIKLTICLLIFIGLSVKCLQFEIKSIHNKGITIDF
jgi:hypothetical protein